MKHLIQFVDLDDLIDENVDTFRVVSLMDMADDNYNRIGYITVRQIQNDNVLSWSYVVGQTDFEGHATHETTGQLDEIADISRHMEEEIARYILGKGGEVRPGIIDIGDREIVFGVWRYWEELYYNQDSEEGE